MADNFFDQFDVDNTAQIDYANFFDQFDKAQAETIAATPNPTGFTEDEQVDGLDYPKLMGQGVGSMIGGGARLLDWAGLGAAATAWRKTGNETSKFYQDSLTPEMKDAMSRELISEDENGDYNLGDANIHTIFGSVAQSLPSMAIGMGIGGVAAKGLIAAGAAKGVGSAVGFGAGEGIVAAGQVGEDTYNEVMKLSDEKFDGSPLYNSLLLDNKTPDEARKEVASAAAKIAGLKAGAGTAIGGAIAGKYLGRLMQGKGSGRLVEGAKGAATEAVTEFGQGLNEAYQKGAAIQDKADPTHNPFKGALNEAALGAVAGGMIGGGLGFAGGASQQPTQARELAGSDVETHNKLDEVSEVIAKGNAAKANDDQAAFAAQLNQAAVNLPEGDLGYVEDANKSPKRDAFISGYENAVMNGEVITEEVAKQYEIAIADRLRDKQSALLPPKQVSIVRPDGVIEQGLESDFLNVQPRETFNAQMDGLTAIAADVGAPQKAKGLAASAKKHALNSPAIVGNKIDVRGNVSPYTEADAFADKQESKNFQLNETANTVHGRAPLPSNQKTEFLSSPTPAQSEAPMIEKQPKDTILTAKGEPFSNPSTAKLAMRKHKAESTHEVVAVDGGYVVQTIAQNQEDQALSNAATRSEASSQATVTRAIANEDVDSLIEFAAKTGGFSDLEGHDLVTTLEGVKTPVGVSGIVNKDGQTLGSFADRAREAGYVPSSYTDGQVLDAVVRSAGGEDVYTAVGHENIVSIKQRADHKEDIIARAKRLGVKHVKKKIERIEAEVFEIEYQKGQDEIAHFSNEQQAYYDGAYKEASNVLSSDAIDDILEEVAMRNQDLNSAEYNQVAGNKLEEATYARKQIIRSRESEADSVSQETGSTRSLDRTQEAAGSGQQELDKTATKQADSPPQPQNTPNTVDIDALTTEYKRMRDIDRQLKSGEINLIQALNSANEGVKPKRFKRKVHIANEVQRLANEIKEAKLADGSPTTKAVVDNETDNASHKQGDFGVILTGFKHDSKGAIAKLKELQGGEAVAALSHPDIGDIDLVWGKEGTNKSDGFGLAKLIKYHPEVVGDLQAIIESMSVVDRTRNRVQIESEDHKGTVSLEWFGKGKAWLLTSYEKGVGVRHSMDTPNVASEGDKLSSQPTPNTPTIADKPDTAKQAASIDDFGEKMGGAAKDYYVRAMDSANKLDIAKVPLAKAFPEPNYAKLIAAGANPKLVAMARAVRDLIPDKPRGRYARMSYMRKYVEAVEEAREKAASFIKMSASKADFGNSGITTQAIEDLAALYEAVGHDKSIKGFNLGKRHYSIYKGEKDVTFWSVRPRRKSTAFGNLPREVSHADTKEEAIKRFKAWYAMHSSKPADRKKVKFGLFKMRSTGKFGIGKKIGRHHYFFKEDYESIKEAREYLDDHYDEIETHFKAWKKVPSHRRDHNNERTGEDRRKGKDVTPEMFTEAFGFRGVEFGNWVSKDGERQGHLNRAYDALSDLASLLNIPTTAISLNGELGLAFGARGKKGSAAHYEGNNVVINLTRKQGAGSLGHEWWHALDNYISRNRKQGDGFVSEHPYKLPMDETRPELLAAFKELQKAINSTGLAERSQRLDTRKAKEYWGTGREMSARSFESYVIKSLEDLGFSNDYLANIISEKDYALEEEYPYIKASEIESIKEAFDNLFKTLKTKKTDKGTALYSKAKQDDAGTAGLTVADVKDYLTTQFGNAAKRAIKKGKVVVVRTADALPESADTQIKHSEDGKIQGAYDPATGITYIVAENNTESSLAGVLLHEAKHAFDNSKVGKAILKKSINQIRALEKLAKNGTGNLAKWMESAKADIPSDTPAENYHEELFAYAVQQHQDGLKQPITIHNIVKRFLAAIKGFVRAHMLKRGIDLKITPETLHALAKQNLGVMGKREFGFNGKPASAKLAVAKDYLLTALKMISNKGDMFKYESSSSKDMEQIAEDIAAPLWTKEMAEDMTIVDADGKPWGDRPIPMDFKIKHQPKEMSADNYWSVQSAYLDHDPKTDVYTVQTAPAFMQFNNTTGVSVTVPSLKSGKSGGSKLYHIAATYAFNNDTVFKGDNGSLSAKAHYRRLENMLSSAIRFKTTDHLAPHAAQLKDMDKGGFKLGKLNWKKGETNHNIHAMLKLSSDYINKAVPSLKNVWFDFETGEFYETQGHDTGTAQRRRPVSEKTWTEAASTGRARQNSIGRGTLKRSVFIKSLNKEQGRDVLAELKKFDLLGGVGEAKGIFYSKAKRSYSEEQQAVLEKLARPEAAPLKERMKESTSWLSRKFRQGVFDQFDSIRRTLDDPRAWMMAHLSKSHVGVVYAAIKHGIPYLKDNAIDIKEGSKGLDEILEPLGEEVDNFFQWVAAHRAERLAESGRENFLNSVDIKALKSLDQGKMEDGSSREAAYNKARIEFEKLHNGIVQISVDTGTVNKDEADQWKDEGFYVPFYRAMDETNHAGAGGLTQLVKQTAYKKLKGADKPFADLLTNVLMNWDHLISASLNNQAAFYALQSAVKMGVAKKVSESEKGKDSVFIRLNGKQEHFEVDDPLVLEALTALNWKGLDGSAMKVGRWFKRALTLGVTASPEFKLRNLFRDTIQAIAVAPMSKNVAKNLAQGFVNTASDGKTIKSMLAGGGAFGDSGYIHGNDPDAIKKLVGLGYDEKHIIKDPLKWLPKAWNTYQDFGARLENVNRAANFKQLRDGGADLLTANFEARDHLDFSRTGSWTAVRALAQLVPFFNARLQGLDKMARAGFNKQQRAQLAAVLGYYSLISIALYLTMKDDEDYKALEQWERDTYHHFKLGIKDENGKEIMFKMPRPFEVGAVANMAERAVEQLADDKVDGDLFTERLGHAVWDTLAMNPLPQALKPAIEVYSNKNSFTGRSIENAGMKRLDPSERKRAWTSSTASTASKVMEAVAGDNALSPVQIEHLVRGYFGWLGAQALVATDQIFDVVNNKPSSPKKRLDEQHVLKAFMKQQPSRFTKYGTAFYENMNELNNINAKINRYRKQGKYQEAVNIRNDNKDKLKYRRRYNRYSRKLSALRKRSETYQNSRMLSPKAKRQAIDKITTEINLIQKKMVTGSEDAF